MPKFKNSNATFWVIFKQCEVTHLNHKLNHYFIFRTFFGSCSSSSHNTYTFGPGWFLECWSSNLDVLCHINLCLSIWDCQAFEKWSNKDGTKGWENGRLWYTRIHPCYGCCGLQYGWESYLDSIGLWRTSYRIWKHNYSDFDLGSFMFTATILIGKVTN